MLSGVTASVCAILYEKFENMTKLKLNLSCFRCSYVRIGTSREQLTDEMKKSIMEKVLEYGTGRDTLRCLALATADDPVDKDDMILTDSTKFASYEVRYRENCNGTILAWTWSEIKL